MATSRPEKAYRRITFQNAAAALFAVRHTESHTNWKRCRGASEVLRRLYGEAGHAITLTNPAVPTIVLQYKSFKQITDDISDARVYEGYIFEPTRLRARS